MDCKFFNYPHRTASANRLLLKKLSTNRVDVDSEQDLVFLICPNGQGRNGSNGFVAGTLP